MAIINGKSKKLSLNKQHDYITLRTPNGNYTVSWKGAKATGRLVQDDKAFTAIDNFIMAQDNYLDGMKELLKVGVIRKLWKNFDKVYAVEKIEVGDFITLTDLFAKKYPGKYEVKEVKRVTIFIQIEDDVMGISKDFMNKVK